MRSESLNILAWQRLKRNKLSFFALYYIVIAVFIALFAVVISPDSSPNANSMYIELAVQKPFTKVLFLEIPKNEKIEGHFLESIFIGTPLKVKRVPIDSFKVLDNGIEYLPYNSAIKQIYILGSIRFLSKLFGLAQISTEEIC